MKEFEELTGATQVASWVPDDIYADLILDGVVCYGQLSGVISAMEYDFTAGGTGGNTVQVRYVPARTASCASLARTDACTCLSEASTTLGTYPVKVLPWGDYDLVCGFSIWESDGPVVKMILNEMAKRMAKCRDEEMWSALTDDIAAGSITHYKFTTVSCDSGTIGGSCCSYTYDLYNSIVSVIQDLRDDAYDPDYVIMSPSVAKALYMKDNGGYWNTPLVRFADGHLVDIAGVKVIECCNAHACSNASGRLLSADTTVTDADGIMAVIIDSKRSIGEAWGKRPTFHEFYDAKCDRYEEVVWQYWGCSAMDLSSIGWVANP